MPVTRDKESKQREQEQKSQKRNIGEGDRQVRRESEVSVLRMSSSGVQNAGPGEGLRAGVAVPASGDTAKSNAPECVPKAGRGGTLSGMP